MCATIFLRNTCVTAGDNNNKSDDMLPFVIQFLFVWHKSRAFIFRSSSVFLKYKIIKIAIDAEDRNVDVFFIIFVLRKKSNLEILIVHFLFENI